MLTSFLKKVLRRQHSKHVYFGVTLFWLLSIAALDMRIDARLSTVVFYIFPVALATWTLHSRAGYWTAGICSLVWSLANSSSPAQPSVLEVFNFCSTLGTYLTVAFMTAILRRALWKEALLARTDRLTGALNLRAFHERLELELERSKRSQRPFTVVYLDADNFKQLNDSLGHKVGDELLQRLVVTLQARLRKIDAVARLGGDEFCLILPFVAPSEAEKIAHDCLEALRGAMQEHCWPVTFSIGVLVVTEFTATVAQIIEAADRLMYAVKKTTKDGFRLRELSTSTWRTTA